MANRWRVRLCLVLNVYKHFLNIFSLSLLMAYTGQTIILRLPEGLTIKDFDWLSVWRTDIQADFGHVMIPKDNLDDIPPALGQNDDLVLTCIT